MEWRKDRHGLLITHVPHVTLTFFPTSCTFGVAYDPFNRQWHVFVGPIVLTIFLWGSWKNNPPSSQGDAP